MSSIQKFEDIKAWQKARVLTKEIYVITKSKSFDNDFDLIRQIRRATVSVMANIAEGFERKRDKQFAHFLDISMGSLAEVKSHLYVCLDLEYIKETDFKNFSVQIEEIGKMCNALRKYLKE
jgi:four helix bundle protein